MLRSNGCVRVLLRRQNGLSVSATARPPLTQTTTPFTRSLFPIRAYNSSFSCITSTFRLRAEEEDRLFVHQQLYSLQQRFFASHEAVQVAVKKKLPPNIKFDPRSSFAPKIRPKSIPLEPDDDKQKDKTAKEDIKKETRGEETEEAEEFDDEEDDDDALYLTTDHVQPVYAVPLPDRLHVPVHTLLAPLHSSEVGTIWLDASVFGKDPVRVDLLKQAVNYYRNKKRGWRKAKSKTISEVSGAGKKMRQQKGTGKARVGHGRPPHFRGGAKAHGPKNTVNYGDTKLNRKVRKAALAHALSQKLLEGNLILLNQLHDLPTHKTKDLSKLLEPWDIATKTGSTALVLDHYYPPEQGEEEKKTNNEEHPKGFSGVPVNLLVAAKNLYKVKVGSDRIATVYDILKHEKLILTLAALEQFEQRLKAT